MPVSDLGLSLLEALRKGMMTANFDLILTHVPAKEILS